MFQGGEGTVEESDFQIDDLVARIRSEFGLVTSDADVVATACAALQDRLADATDSQLTTRCCERLAPLLGRQHGESASALFAFLASQLPALADPRPVVEHMLASKDPILATRGLDIALDSLGDCSLTLDLELLHRIAGLVDTEGETPHRNDVLTRMAALLRRNHTIPLPCVEGDPVESLFIAGPTPHSRLFAARILDQARGSPSRAVCEQVLGSGATDHFFYYLQYTGATHADLVDLTPTPGEPPPLLASLRQAEETLGRAVLGALIAELGWAHVACGIAVEGLVGVSVDGSFPFTVQAREVELLAGCGRAQELWKRSLVIAHGSVRPSGDFNTEELQVRRFRQYNVMHAELLNDILAVAPLTREGVERLMARMQVLVDDFVVLFGQHTEEASRLSRVYAQLRSRIRDSIERAPAGDTLSAAVTRLVNQFEDPRCLDEVHTLHGLKRYLHQQGLRLAFRLFRASQSTNRSVDLVIISDQKILRVSKTIRYLDFEMSRGFGPAALPFPVYLAARSLGQQLLQAVAALPQVTILVYGNEVQVYANFRNHPAFVRIDFSPPQRGGMIDLEYFGVSQYEYDHHPDLSLQGIQQLFKQLDFDIQEDRFRLHARYDKERTVDLGQLIHKVRQLFCLLPYLMDVDWIIGGMDYPEPTRRVIAAAWADFFERWNALPCDDVLSKDRRRVRCGYTTGPTVNGEVIWDGQGDYHDPFTHGPGVDLLERLRSNLEVRGLAHIMSSREHDTRRLGQARLESTLLEPLRQAMQVGEAVVTCGRIEAASDAVFERMHEAKRLAEILLGSGKNLVDATMLARVVRSIERQLHFQASGSIQGYAVQSAIVPLRGEELAVFALRNVHDEICLALAARPFLYRHRERSSDPWVVGGELAPSDVLGMLRNDNYLPEDAAVDAAEDDPQGLELLPDLQHPNPHGSLHVDVDARSVSGLVAAPGRASGRARFLQHLQSPADAQDTILLAPSLRPQDTPFLGRAAAVVTTGGSMLSHVGLMALEQEKPALIISGLWERTNDVVLRCKRPICRVGRLTVGTYDVLCQHQLRQEDEVIEEGDLVVVDGSSATLWILGHDRQALALDHELRALQDAGVELGEHIDGARILALRGRLLRAVHQLGRLAGRIERPELARYAVREILFAKPAAYDAPTTEGRRKILRSLFTNPSCGAAALDAARKALGELSIRHQRLAERLLQTLPRLEHAVEVLYARLHLLQLRQRLFAVRSILEPVDLDEEPPLEVRDLDACFMARLQAMLSALSQRLTPFSRTGTLSPSSLHACRQAQETLRVLDMPAATQWRDETETCLQMFERRHARALRVLAGRNILGCEDGGTELLPLVGGKAANLGEMARAVGTQYMSPWFAVSHRAFQSALACPPPRSIFETLGLDASGCESVAAAITKITARNDLDARRQSSQIRALWQALELPEPLAEEIRAAYRRLSPQVEANVESDVAVRSSAFEEDTQGRSWAGQFDTFLFVRGAPALLEHLKLAWAGLWTARAIQQRALLGQPEVPGGGVIVQQMVDARVSGVLQTVSLARGELDEMLVSVGLGLGEGIVSGVVDADQIFVVKSRKGEDAPLRFRYRVADKRSRAVFDTRRGQGTRLEETAYHQRLRPALDYTDLCELVRVARQLEVFFAQPLDIEFAFDESQLRLLQARPIAVFHSALEQTATRFKFQHSGVKGDRSHQ